ncbi:MAG: lauroyl-Kdo(2)-lipid IV(A) myristoyltransferase [Gammaproteobacteria bacterium]|nr:lauroyl-Kdo(2)-lipid IV(A) myristoyltransferase [Gammaproteobacteria bacterium]
MSKKIARSPLSHTEYVPLFQRSFFLPKYWLTWTGVFILWLLMFSTSAFRNKIAAVIVRLTVKKNSRQYRVVKTNLELCFAEKTETDIEEMAGRFFYYKARIFLDYAFLWFAGEKKLQQIYQIYNDDELKVLNASGNNIILLTCHMLALDHGAQALSFDYPVIGLVKAIKNPVTDWLVARGRTRFNTRLYERSFGMKGIVSSIKKGDQFFYLPDEDLGNERSEFLPFFGVQKATITALGRLAKICDAKVVPCVPVFNESNGKYEVRFLHSMVHYPTGDKVADAVTMNQMLEEMILLAPEQYLWSFRYFKTRPDGEPPVY